MVGQEDDMPFIDLPLDELRTFSPPLEEPGDFNTFWTSTIAEARRHPLAAAFARHEAHLKLIEVFDLTFNGYAGQPVKGWFLLPAVRKGKLPCVVEFIGYGGGRGLPHDWLTFPAAGYALLVMDTRGQGSVWRTGDTPDPEMEGGNPQFPGFMTRGILKKETYYYRRVFTDAARAVEAASSHEAVDAERIAVTGGSQGGGIAVAAAGLVPEVKLALPDVPFLSCYQRAISITDAAPYVEIRDFLKRHRHHEAAVWQTLSYFEGRSFAARAKGRSLFSVALMDEICPPSTVFATYNRWAGPKDINVWPYNNHEGGETFQTVEKLKFLEKYL
jgi:cephalosporin-C deacetylase